MYVLLLLALISVFFGKVFEGIHVLLLMCCVLAQISNIHIEIIVFCCSLYFFCETKGFNHVRYR